MTPPAGPRFHRFRIADCGFQTCECLKSAIRNPKFLRSRCTRRAGPGARRGGLPAPRPCLCRQPRSPGRRLRRQSQPTHQVDVLRDQSVGGRRKRVEGVNLRRSYLLTPRTSGRTSFRTSWNLPRTSRLTLPPKVCSLLRGFVPNPAPGRERYGCQGRCRWDSGTKQHVASVAGFHFAGSLRGPVLTLAGRTALFAWVPASHRLHRQFPDRVWV